jgi:hypothetical protein
MRNDRKPGHAQPGRARAGVGGGGEGVGGVAADRQHRGLQRQAVGRHRGVLAEDQREAAAGCCAARAVQLLCRDREAGHFNTTANIDRFLKDRRFDAVRQRDDYRALAAMLKPRDVMTP